MAVGSLVPASDVRAALRIGLVVKDPNFTLYDAVGALEVRRSATKSTASFLRLRLDLDHGPKDG